MRTLNKALAVAAVLACTIGLPAAQAGDNMDSDKFVTMCDKDKDGMVSKAEVMKMVEQTFDKHDKKKMGKLDKNQTEAFLKELLRGS